MGKDDKGVAAMSWFSDLLREFPAVEVARERIALLETKFTDIQVALVV
jgi:hypothetical protein